MKLFDNKQTYCPVCNGRLYYDDSDQHYIFNYSSDYRTKSGHAFAQLNNVAIISFVIDMTSIEVYDDLKYQIHDANSSKGRWITIFESYFESEINSIEQLEKESYKILNSYIRNKLFI